MADGTGNQNIAGTPSGAAPISGDVTGSTAAATVAKIQGKAVPAPGAPESGKVLRYNDATGATEWISPTAGGGGVSVADKSAFVEGTDSFTPVGGVYDEVQGADPAEDSAIVLRMTVKRAAHVNLRTAAGTEIGTAGSPLRTDPTGTTPQPVSGSVSVSNFPGTQPISGSVSVSNLAADQLVHAANLDIATSALRDAITAAGAAAKTLADVVTAITQAQAVAGSALPNVVSAAAGYDTDQGKVRPLPVAMIQGTPRAIVDDSRVRQELRHIRLALHELIELQRGND